MNRRNFLYQIGLATGGAMAAFHGFQNRALAFAETGNLANFRAAGFGDLVPTATKNTSETFLALPKGFEYNVIGKVKNPLSDGRMTPGAHDGMATFQVKNELRIVRNHEVANGSQPRENAGIAAANHYDETAGGGTTTLIVNPKTKRDRPRFRQSFGNFNQLRGRRDAVGKLDYVRRNDARTNEKNSQRRQRKPAVSPNRTVIVLKFRRRRTASLRPCRSKRWADSFTKRLRSIGKRARFI
jgi:secreted PhoX family phosphatase